MADPKEAAPTIAESIIKARGAEGVKMRDTQMNGPSRFANISGSTSARDMLLNALLGLGQGAEGAAAINKLGDPTASFLSGISAGIAGPKIQDIRAAQAKAQAESQMAQFEAMPIEQVSSGIVQAMYEKYGIDFTGVPLGQFNKFTPIIDKLQKHENLFTPEQLDAISTGDPKKLAKVFPGGIPKEAVNLTYGAERISNLETERNERGDERLKARQRNYFLDLEQRDPIIKEIRKQDLNMGSIDALMELARQGNTVAFSGVGIKMAKGMGEVGVMTETDIKRYVTSGTISRGAADTLTKWIKGVPTEATQEELKQISRAMSTAFNEKVQPRYDQFINTYSKIERMPPERFAADLGLSYSGGKSSGEIRKQVNTAQGIKTGVWDSKGKFLRYE